MSEYHLSTGAIALLFVFPVVVIAVTLLFHRRSADR